MAHRKLHSVLIVLLTLAYVPIVSAKWLANNPNLISQVTDAEAAKLIGGDGALCYDWVPNIPPPGTFWSCGNPAIEVCPADRWDPAGPGTGGTTIGNCGTCANLIFKPSGNCAP